MSDEIVHAVVYDLTTGAVLKAMTCRRSLIGIQFDPASQGVVELAEACDEPSRFVVENGTALRRLDDIPPPPESYVDKRRRDFPSFNDQVGAIMSWLEIKRKDGELLPPDLVDMLDKIEAVKLANPKEALFRSNGP